VLQEENGEAGIFGLAPMYQISDWSIFAPDHHGYPRAPDLIKRNASSGKPEHQGSGTPGRPFLHPFRFSRRPRQGIRLHPYIAFFLIPVSSFVRSDGRSFAPTCV
jgi:hypothetical protein